MKIICIGRNYVDHAKELNNETPSEPVVFLKPDSAILPKGNAFYIPSFTNEVHHEVELVVRINRLGKHIEPRFAHRYYDEVTLGIDFTARDVQKACKEKGLPWEKAKAFDGSAVIGPFISLKEAGEIDNLDLKLYKNDELVQHGNTRDMLFHVDQLIAHVSQYMTLKIGDLLFTGTPAGVSKVNIGDRLVGQLNDRQLFKTDIR